VNWLIARSGNSQQFTAGHLTFRSAGASHHQKEVHLMHKSVLAGIAALSLGMLMAVPAAQAAPKQATGTQLAQAEAAPAEKPVKKTKKAKKHHGHGHKKAKKDSSAETK
jgi:hypothetical protein